MTNKSDTSSIQGDTFIDELQKKVDKAIESREPIDVSIAQLEIQFAMLQYLQRLDWKLWELYNKFGI